MPGLVLSICSAWYARPLFSSACFTTWLLSSFRFPKVMAWLGHEAGSDRLRLDADAAFLSRVTHLSDRVAPSPKASNEIPPPERLD